MAVRAAADESLASLPRCNVYRSDIKEHPEELAQALTAAHALAAASPRATDGGGGGGGTPASASPVPTTAGALAAAMLAPPGLLPGHLVGEGQAALAQRVQAAEEQAQAVLVSGCHPCACLHAQPLLVCGGHSPGRLGPCCGRITDPPHPFPPSTVLLPSCPGCCPAEAAAGCREPGNGWAGAGAGGGSRCNPPAGRHPQRPHRRAGRCGAWRQRQVSMPQRTI